MVFPATSRTTPNPWSRRLLSFLTLAGLATVAACDEGVVNPPEPSVDPAPTELGPSALSVAAQQAGPGQAIPGNWIVVFNRDVPDAPGLANRLANQHGAVPSFVYAAALNGFAAPLSDQAVAALRRNPNVDYIEQDRVATKIGTQNNPTWGLDRIDQRQRPLDGTYTYENEGAGVSAYILDTGIRTTHSEFAGRAAFAADFIGDGNEGVNNGDCDGHGTHVAGTVGGTTYGVAKGVDLYAVRVLGCNGSGSYSGVIAGVDWVVANHVAPAVANMSLGGGLSTGLNQAIETAVQSGIFFAVAAGNDNTDACNRSPASAPSAFTVGASTSSDARSSFSNYGSCVDIFAPGSAITSSTHGSDVSTGTWSGTSMASPHVAGAAALYLADDPALTPSQVTSALEQNGTSGVLSGLGTGSPNLLLFSGLGSAPPPPPPPMDITVHAASVAVSVTFKRNNANGTASVQVVDEAGNAVPGASVTGDWRVDGSLEKSGTSGVSDAAGVATIGSGGMRGVKDTQVIEFCVSDISGTGVVYDETANLETCGTGGGGAPPPTGFVLSADAIKGGNQVQLAWSGSSAGSFEVFRDTTRLGSTSGDSWRDDPPGGTWMYEVCEVGGACLQATVTTRR